MVEFVTFSEAEPLLDWLELTDALADGHCLAKAEISDQLLYRGDDAMLTRAAWIDGLGSAVKTAFVVPSNSDRGLPTTAGAVSLFNDRTGELEALLDFRLVTKWKTAGDSLLAARRLARRDSADMLIVGAGAVARSLVEAYSAVFPSAAFTIWNRTWENAEKLVSEYENRADIRVADDLAAAVNRADIVACATIALDPVLRGEWLSPGTHVDLIGAYRPDMRETDDAALLASRIFVDSRDTTLQHIGELKTPLELGVISNRSVIADFYDLPDGSFARTGPSEITLFKNGGGAHLDLMTSNHILSKWQCR